MELLLIIVLSLVLVPLALFTSGAPRIILGLAFIIFFPGYTMLSALFPRKGGLSSIERVALSFGLSIAVTPLIGLLLNYTPWGIHLLPLITFLFLFMVIMSAIAWYRRRIVPSEERFRLQLHLSLSPLTRFWSSQYLWGRVLTVLLLVVIVGFIGSLGYAFATPREKERFTEFYILGQEGKLDNYPQELVLGEAGKVTLGVVNHEQKTIDYRISIVIDGKKVKDIGTLTLNDSEKQELEVAFTPVKVGTNQKVDFLLYKGTDDQPYHTLYLSINVTGRDRT